MFSSAQEILDSLTMLGQVLERENSPCTAVLICGGAALSLSDLSTRTTADVDVIGTTTGSNDDLGAMPDYLLEAAVEVSRILGIEIHWFNDAAAAIISIGLPDGMIDRAEPIRFGEKLTVLVAARPDLIALKSFAALDPRNGGKHLEDLVDLEPSQEELHSVSK